MVVAARSTACNRRGGGQDLFPRLLTAPYEQTFHFGLKFGKDAVESLAARIEYDGPIGIQCRQFQADGLPHAAFKTIALDCFPERLWSGEANARARSRQIGETKGGEVRTGVASPLIIDFSEIAGSKQPDTFGKTRFRFGGNLFGRDPGYLSELTVSFLRPAARRREITAAPSAVFMRVRKPCVLARLRLFGWKVRFGIYLFS